MAGEKLCSWDAEINPRYRLVTTGNVEEVLPGIIKPLTADLINQWDYRFTTRMAEELGVLDLVPTAPPPAMNVLGVVGGRWTLGVAWSMAITSTYQVSGGTDMLKQFVEGDELTAGQAQNLERAKAARRRIMARWRNADREIERGREISERAYRQAWAREYPRLRGEELLRAVEENVGVVAGLFTSHVIVSVGGAEYTGMLGALLGEHLPGHPPAWVTTLTSALTDVESAKPGKATWDLARAGRKSAVISAAAAELPNDALLARLAAPVSPAWEAFAAGYRELIREYGFRGPRETDPSTATWDEAPALLLGALRADMAAPASADPHRKEARAAAARERLEEQIAAKLPAKAQAAFRETLAMAQRLNRGREGTKANWARACRAFRPPLLETGRRLARRGALEQPEDVFFLRLAEVREFETLDAAAAKAAVRARQEEYRRLEGFRLPEGVFELPTSLLPAESGAPAEGALAGQGVSPGTATGPARVIADADAALAADIQPGDVLVLPVFDAPMAPLFVPAAALVVETGGMLSHAAIVAREYGIPAVVGVKDATRRIRDGQQVTVDGSAGTVALA
ncbi:PEP-utilizing enzyme [Tepidiforma flava]|uniref:PEP-utilizing enzyme n=1 Tax=Tepidiforma flava TaxID=3004094 RepID=A0ABY7M9D5_9CHLR|nr:PEP-utilizing enzyme [Tepidiforma flava]WBL37115.1 PEP-utilizing enzyme [Tepidiforma flava]